MLAGEIADAAMEIGRCSGCRMNTIQEVKTTGGGRRPGAEPPVLPVPGKNIPSWEACSRSQGFRELIEAFALIKLEQRQITLRAKALCLRIPPAGGFLYI